MTKVGWLVLLVVGYTIPSAHAVPDIMQSVRKEYEAFAQCNRDAAKTFASQQGDAVSLGFAAYSKCALQEIELKLAIVRHHGQRLADKVMLVTKEGQIGRNAAMIAELRSKVPSAPSPSGLADETNMPANPPADFFEGSEEEMLAFNTCTLRTSMLAAQGPEDAVSIASAAQAACKFELNRWHKAVARAHGKEWADWMIKRYRQKTLEHNAAKVSDIKAGRLIQKEAD